MLIKDFDKKGQKYCLTVRKIYKHKQVYRLFIADCLWIITFKNNMFEIKTAKHLGNFGKDTQQIFIDFGNVIFKETGLSDEEIKKIGKN